MNLWPRPPCRERTDERGRGCQGERSKGGKSFCSPFSFEGMERKGREGAIHTLKFANLAQKTDVLFHFFCPHLIKFCSSDNVESLNPDIGWMHATVGQILFCSSFLPLGIRGGRGGTFTFRIGEGGREGGRRRHDNAT